MVLLCFQGHTVGGGCVHAGVRHTLQNCYKAVNELIFE